MTGDGVNDILALKKADCSIAMGSGSSAARNVAHIVSVDNNFSKLPDVVAEGRRAINNLQRSASLFLAKTIFAIVLSFVFLLSQTSALSGSRRRAIQLTTTMNTKPSTVWYMPVAADMP